MFIAQHIRSKEAIRTEKSCVGHSYRRDVLENVSFGGGIGNRIDQVFLLIAAGGCVLKDTSSLLCGDVHALANHCYPSFFLFTYSVALLVSAPLHYLLRDNSLSNSPSAE